jgi:predicted AlkP superfamily pyrophosphatase or phosphodiesterase
MKRIILCLAITFNASLIGAQAKHVILISIDGFRPDFYKDPSWPAPHLQRWKAEGVYADGVRSVFPSVTYPSHTTLVTGALPARHGIYYNVPYGEKKGHWYWEESYIQTTTLWDAVKKAGLRSAAVMWPVTVGAPIDYNFPVRRADNDEETDQLTVTLPYITPAALIDEIQEKATGKLSAKSFNDENLDITIGNMGAYIFKTYKPNLMALHFLGADHMQHKYGRDAEETKKAVALIDSMINLVMASVAQAGLQDQTAVIITGDHGFVDSKYTFSPNILLEQAGLFSKTNPVTTGWTAKFHGVGGSAFLYLKNKNDKATVDRVKKLLNDLPEEQKKLFRIVDRNELDQIGANPEVAMALAMDKGVVTGSDVSGELIKARKKGGNHGYYPDFDEINTGFIAFGAGIQKQQRVALMGVKDIAPLVTSLLKLSFQSPDGILIPGILTDKK